MAVSKFRIYDYWKDKAITKKFEIKPVSACTKEDDALSITEFPDEIFCWACQMPPYQQGSSEGGSFSLFLQYYMKPELLFDVPPEKFLPAPKVTSAVIRCVRRERPAVDVADESFFFKVMRGGFLLRRKTLANSLSAALPGIPKESIQQAIADMGLPAAVRGEQLTLEDFAALSAALGREADGD